MTKIEFLHLLKKELAGIPKDIRDNYLSYYSEMIDDMTEDGSSEEQAVLSVGDAKEVAQHIISEVGASKSTEKKAHKLKWWHILLIILGSPVWLSLLIAVGSVAVSIAVSAVSVLISLYAVNLALAASAVAGIFYAVFYVSIANYAGAAMVIGTSFFCAGCAILLFFALKKLALLILSLCKKIIHIKFKKKEAQI